jgi:hypothetical protein
MNIKLGSQKNFQITNFQSLVKLFKEVSEGLVSCRRASKEVQKQLPTTISEKWGVCTLPDGTNQDIYDHIGLQEVTEKNYPFIPANGSLWLVAVECRYTVIEVSPVSKGFFIPGQEPCWGLDHVQEWIHPIENPLQKHITPSENVNILHIQGGFPNLIFKYQKDHKNTHAINESGKKFKIELHRADGIGTGYDNQALFILKNI